VTLKYKATKRVKPNEKDIPNNLPDYVAAVTRLVETATAGGTDGLIRRLNRFVDEFLRVGSKKIATKLSKIRKIAKRNPIFFEPPKVSPKKFKSVDDLRDKARNVDSLKNGDFIEINGKHKIWQDKDGAIYHDSEVGDSLGSRAGTEKEFFSAGDSGIEGLEGMERAHSLGQGTGFESPFGIRSAPKLVNQLLQNQGIEELIRTLHASLKASGNKVRVKTRTKTHNASLRLKEITYKLEITTSKGKAVPLFEYAIEVGNKGLPNPSVADGITYVHNATRVRALLQQIKGKGVGIVRLKDLLGAAL